MNNDNELKAKTIEILSEPAKAKPARTLKLPCKLIGDDRVGDYMVDADGTVVDFNTDGDYLRNAVNAYDSDKALIAELVEALKKMSQAFETVANSIPPSTQIGIAEALEIETAKVNADKLIHRAEASR